VPGRRVAAAAPSHGRSGSLAGCVHGAAPVHPSLVVAVGADSPRRRGNPTTAAVGRHGGQRDPRVPRVPHGRIVRRAHLRRATGLPRRPPRRRRRGTGAAVAASLVAAAVTAAPTTTASTRRTSAEPPSRPHNHAGPQAEHSPPRTRRNRVRPWL